MDCGDVKLLADACFNAIKDKPGKYVLHESGSIALVMDFGQEGPFVAYLNMNGSDVMSTVYDDLRSGATGPRGVELGVDRCVVTLTRAARGAHDQVNIGCLVICEEGTFVAAKHWSEVDSMPMVNVYSGAVTTLYGNIPILVADHWSLTAYRGDAPVFELSFPATQ